MVSPTGPRPGPGTPRAMPPPHTQRCPPTHPRRADLKHQQVAQTFTRPGSTGAAVCATALSPNDKYLAAAGADGSLSIFMVQSGLEIAAVPLAPGVPKPTLEYHPAERHVLAAGAADGGVYVVDTMTTRTTAAVPSVHTAPVAGLSWSSHDPAALVSCGGHTVAVTDLRARPTRPAARLRAAAGCTALSCASGGAQEPGAAHMDPVLAVGHQDGSVSLYDLRSPAEPLYVAAAFLPGPVRCLEWQRSAPPRGEAAGTGSPAEAAAPRPAGGTPGTPPAPGSPPRPPAPAPPPPPGTPPRAAPGGPPRGGGEGPATPPAGGGRGIVDVPERAAPPAPPAAAAADVAVPATLAAERMGSPVKGLAAAAGAGAGGPAGAGAGAAPRSPLVASARALDRASDLGMAPGPRTPSRRESGHGARPGPGGVVHVGLSEEEVRRVVREEVGRAAEDLRREVREGITELGVEVLRQVESLGQEQGEAAEAVRREVARSMGAVMATLQGLVERMRVR